MKVMQSECPFCREDIEDCRCQVDSDHGRPRNRDEQARAAEVERLLTGLSMMDWD